MVNNIQLPYSKSISNRAILLSHVMQQLGMPKMVLHNLSEADDTLLLENLIGSTQEKIDVKNAGTCLRFLLAWFASNSLSEVFIDGSPRMRQRPISGLVEALSQLGAKIEYLEETNRLPLKVSGAMLNGGQVSIDAGLSSQFVSALLMVAPLMKHPLTLNLSGTIVSKPYITMTLQMMKAFGIELNWHHQLAQISVTNNWTKGPNEYFIERDWSSAAFFYQWILIDKHQEFFFPGLSLKSLQGDSRIAEILAQFGVKTEETNEGIYIGSTQKKAETAKIDFTDIPDLAPALLCGLAGGGISFEATGLESLRVKESDRVLALYENLNALGFLVTNPQWGTLAWNGSYKKISTQPSIQTHQDHRLTMAFAILGKKYPLLLSEEDSVIKSFPHFFDAIR